MAFTVWIPTNTTGKILDGTDFASDSQTLNGFAAGEKASSIRVNSALRQANLIGCAMMDALGITNYDLTSTRQNVANAISTYFTNKFAGKLDLNGDASNAKVSAFTVYSTRTNLVANDTFKAICGKIKKYFGDLQTLAFNSSVSTSLLNDNSVTEAKLAAKSVGPSKFKDGTFASSSQARGFTISLSQSTSGEPTLNLSIGDTVYLDKVVPANESVQSFVGASNLRYKNGYFYRIDSEDATVRKLSVIETFIYNNTQPFDSDGNAKVANALNNSALQIVRGAFSGNTISNIFTFTAGFYGVSLKVQEGSSYRVATMLLNVYEGQSISGAFVFGNAYSDVNMTLSNMKMSLSKSSSASYTNVELSVIKLI